MKKRITTSLVLVLAMCLTPLPAAAYGDYYGSYGSYDGHTHYLCGAGSSSDYYYSGSCTCSSKEISKTFFQTKLTQSSDGTLQKDGATWSAADNNYELKTGNYYLTGDLTLEHSILITGDVKLCLNGHSITCNAGTSDASVPVIEVRGGDASFTLTNCQTYRECKITHTAGKYGCGVYNNGVFNMYGGTITGNITTNCAGVYNGGTFNLYGGTISDNKNVGNVNAVNNGEGGGVYNGDLSTLNANVVFNMYGGTISGNTAGYGGGVYNKGTFKLSGGTISGNGAAQGGGVYSYGSGTTFTMSGGMIGGTNENSGNTAEYYGGGVSNQSDSAFTMSGGMIAGNKVTASNIGAGGGVFNIDNATFTMSGGTIGGSEAGKNTSANYGGGVYTSGTFTMTQNAEVSYNTATSNGGGVYNNCSTFSLTDGKIMNNTAAIGGGVYCNRSGDKTGAVTLSGKARIAGNRAGDANSNLYLLKDGTVSAAGLTAGAGIGVSTAVDVATSQINVAVTSDAVSANYFTSDNSSYETMLTQGTSPNRVGLTKRSVIETHTHSCVCGATHTTGNGHDTESKLTNWVGVSDLNLITGAGNYYLTKNVTLTEAIAYGSGAYCGWKAPDGIVLCLNGKNITMQNPDDLVYESDKDKNEDVILVTGRFTLTDCKSYTEQGKITHATDKIGRGIEVLGGTFDMYGGQIAGNKTTEYGTGGGVHVEGAENAASSTAFNLYGGSINNNQSGYGGGVYVSRVVWEGASQFNMYGGSITGNTSTVTDDTSSYGIGGGVCVSWTAAFKMTGGQITGNTAKFDGAGVYLSALARSYESDYGGTAKFEVSGSPQITDNTLASGGQNNVYFDTSTESNEYSGFTDTVDASITILDELSDTAKIGVTAKKMPTAGNRVLVATGADPNEDYSNIFTSDNTEYEVQKRNDNTLKLAVKGDSSADSAKATQSALNITGDSTVTYGNTLRLTAEGGTTKNAVKWYVKNIDGSATIDENGVLTPISAGNVTVTAIMPGDDTYADVSATRTVDIDKATVVITALNKRAYVGNIVPALPETPVEDTDYTVAGLIGYDKLTKLPTLKYVDTEGNDITPDMTKVNDVVISISGATASDNYKIKFVDGKLVIANRSSSKSSSTTYSVSISGNTENGSVSSDVKNAANGDTVTITVKPDSGYVLDDLTVTDKNGNELKLTDKGNGKYTFAMPAGKVEVKAAFAKEIETSPFADVATDAYYYEAVKWASKNEITGGIDDDIFAPDADCTRAQIVTFLWRAADSPEPKAMSGFSDVPADSYYAKAVAWAVENGITTGKGDGKFGPEATCTRAQSVTFLCRAVGKPVEGEAAFSDVSDDSYYANAVAWAVKNNVTNGVAEGMFGPDNSCTRAQIVTFLYRAYQ